MHSLKCLHDEIVCHIFDEVDSPRDLVALARTCRSIYTLCDLPHRRKFRRVRIRSYKDYSRALSFLRAILWRPRYASYVRYLEIDQQPEFDFSFEPERTQRHEFRDLDLLARAIKAVGFSGQEGEKVLNMLVRNGLIFRYPMNSQQQAQLETNLIYMGQTIAVLILTSCRNLKTLKINTPGASSLTDHSFLQFPLYRVIRNIHDAGTETKFLHMLDSIQFLNPKFTLEQYQTVDFVGCMELVQNLPSLKSISVEGMTRSATKSINLDTCNSTNISIRTSIVSSKCLASVFFTTKDLREFTYTSGIWPPLSASIEYLNPRTLFQSLLRHRSTLQRLDLGCDTQIVDLVADIDGITTDLSCWPSEEDNPSFAEDANAAVLRSTWEQTGSLADFTALNHLTIGIECLVLFAMGMFFGSHVDSNRDGHGRIVDALPVNLEYLCLRGRGWNVPFECGISLDRLLWDVRKHRPGIRVEGLQLWVPHVAHGVGDEEWSDHEY
ncbi:hypothetical protein BDV19DRAFT_385269 [Aspergillus venezuelensis]